ncbi:carboxylesterase [Cyanobium sp. Morenito 9A2]|uniref:alpha/beta hydrolase n=1 Tax=Cyanobium sp. Morenito 9A2 TaxID=2823718 RepID=UPI0020CF4B34|nr:alpha/beta fold hydrolase [Cyanobium sp. Morenito 9A2]MCP9848885.1 alpha/beta fold hydrolase [Cyanobium sp. Morenito 9A2]
MVGAQAPLGALLLHGFTGNPTAMRPLEAPLRALGCPVAMPLLRGHGGPSPAALEAVRWPDWVADGAQALVRLRHRAEHVIVVGHSMGALVALQLAADHGASIDSLVLAAAPLQLASPLAPGRPLQLLRPLLQRLLHRWPIPKTYRDPSLAIHDSSYAWAPMAPLLSFLDFSATTRARLGEVSCPALILQSHADPVVLDASVPLLCAGLATPAAEKRVVWFERSGHELVLDLEGPAVVATVMEFVGERLMRG